MIRFKVPHAFIRCCLALCLLGASLVAAPTTLAVPADADDAGHWLSVGSLTDLLDSVGHWVASLAQASQGEEPPADATPSQQHDDPALTTATQDDRGIGPALDPTG